MKHEENVYQSLYNMAFAIEGPLCEPCYKCKNRKECKDFEKFINFEQQLARNLQDMQLFGIDPIQKAKDMIEASKDELICQNFIDDETISVHSHLGLIELQKNN